MLKFASTFALLAALSGALLFATPAPSPAGGAPIVTGGGHWEIAGGDTVGFSVSVVERPDGSLNGGGVSYRHSPTLGNSWFHFDVADCVFIGDEVFVVGVITDTFNTPGDWEGAWTVLAIQDNGSGQGSADTAISSSGIPSFVTLPQILQLLTLPPPAGPPPTAAWFPLEGGNFQIH